MNVEHVNPFIQEAQRILQAVCKDDLKLCKIYIKQPPFRYEEISVVVGINGNIRGQVLYTLSEETACKIAGQMMGGMIVQELNDMTRSAVSELANMISGNVATDFAAKGIMIDITPPVLAAGGDQIQTLKEVDKWVCVPLAFPDDNVFEIDIYFP